MKQRVQITSDLKPGQHATLFPSLGYFDAERRCFRALVHGRVYVDGRVPIGNRLLLRGLKRAMQVNPEEFDSETFQRRIDAFLAAPARRRRIVLEVAGQQYRLRRRTRRNGLFYGTLTLPHQFEPTTAELDLRLLRLPLDDVSHPVGRIHMVPPTGLSVISDIDDTIKMTQATSRKEMLANTFLRPFEVIEGMPQLYQQWQAQGCCFHYVSSSPWQLYEPLAELCAASEFPSGSMHLRYFRVRDEMFKRFRPLRRNLKVGIIAGIFRRLPQRKFVLVGDSGEKDPEIYRFLARRFPNQVSAILIRELSDRPLTSKRLKKLSSLPSPIQLRVFRHSEEVADVVPELIRRS